MFVVFDLDGTIACMKHRAHMIARWEHAQAIPAGAVDHNPPPAPDWEGFYRACIHDKPVMPIINTMIAFRSAGARVEIWTGRSDFVRAETQDWLDRNYAPRVHAMHMRPHGDHRPDTELKFEWLLACDRVPDLVFEDRARVVSMFRREGIRVAQVAEGDF